jgi:hypothetical protein
MARVQKIKHRTRMQKNRLQWAKLGKILIEGCMQEAFAS